MSYLVLKERQNATVVPVKIFEDPQQAQAILQPMRWKLLGELVDSERSARELAKKLGTSEQVACYHLKELEKPGFIRLARTEKRRGATAKYYRAEHKALAVVSNMRVNNPSSGRAEVALMDVCSKVLGPFTSSGQFNGFIVIGSPDAHGIFRARARCGHRVGDLALFLGSLLPITRELVVRLDTEVAQGELVRNLILVGGPRVNTVSMMINEWLPITYELTGQNMMMSTISGRSYAGEEEGAVQMIANPSNQNSRILIIAGNTYLGTRAAMLAFIKYTEDIASGNVFNRNIVARVVTGVDQNSDGLIDDVEFLE